LRVTMPACCMPAERCKANESVGSNTALRVVRILEGNPDAQHLLQRRFPFSIWRVNIVLASIHTQGEINSQKSAIPRSDSRSNVRVCASSVFEQTQGAGEYTQRVQPVLGKNQEWIRFALDAFHTNSMTK